MREGRIEARRASASGWGLVELLGALLLAVALPTWLRSLFENYRAGEPSQVYAVAGTTIAVLAGAWFMRRFIHYPGFRASSFILPTFLASYGAVLTTFFFFRLDYSRFQFVVSFALCLAWYVLVYIRSRRGPPPRIGILPVGDAMRLETIPGVRWRRLGSPERSFAGFDSLVADFRADMPDDWERYVADAALRGMPVYHMKQLEESLTGRVDIEHLSENNLGSLVPGMSYLKIKRVVDVLAALVLGTVLLPLMVLIALAIRLDTPGPSLFRQVRLGYRGRRITVYKFRTMHHGVRAEAISAREQAITLDRDPRITRLGRVLRASRLDELPQIINIVRGEMSWIGPRPEAVALSEWYEAELPFYRYRHIVRPGITGWAQVNQGHVADVADVLFKLHYDFYYIKYFSPWLDFLIALRTLRTMATGFGSR